MKLFRFLVFSISVFYAIFFSGIISQDFAIAFGCDTPIDGLSDRELEELLVACDKEIAENQKVLTGVQAQKITLEAGIQELDYKIRQSELEIKRRAIAIAALGDEIYEKELYVDELEDTVKRIQISLAELVRESNEIENTSPVEAFLASAAISEFFIDADSFAVLKRELATKIEELKIARAETEEAKTELEEVQEEERIEKFSVEKAKQSTEVFKEEKERILDVTKGEEAKYKQIIAEKAAKKKAIENKILNIGTIEITFGDALKIIQPYEARLGVDSALVLSILTQETGIDGIIGSNLGRCNYNQPYSNGSGTVMSDSQKEAFLQIMSELGMDPNTAPVSCPIKPYPYGGAMGPSQFMPNTWIGYRNRVASTVGVDFASPFTNEHAFVGTMLYLQDAQTRCATAFSSQFDLWSCSAAKYYSGLGSKGSRLLGHMTAPSSYGYRVASRAQGFLDDIKFLSS